MRRKAATVEYSCSEWNRWSGGRVQRLVFRRRLRALGTARTTGAHPCRNRPTRRSAVQWGSAGTPAGADKLSRPGGVGERSLVHSRSRRSPNYAKRNRWLLTGLVESSAFSVGCSCSPTPGLAPDATLSCRPTPSQHGRSVKWPQRRKHQPVHQTRHRRRHDRRTTGHLLPADPVCWSFGDRAIYCMMHSSSPQAGNVRR